MRELKETLRQLNWIQSQRKGDCGKKSDICNKTLRRNSEVHETSYTLRKVNQSENLKRRNFIFRVALGSSVLPFASDFPSEEEKMWKHTTHKNCEEFYRRKNPTKYKTLVTNNQRSHLANRYAQQIGRFQSDQFVRVLLRPKRNRVVSSGAF